MKHWYKILSVILIFYTIVWGLLGPVPARFMLYETIRNLYFHVPIWFCMLFLMGLSFYYSIRSLSGNDPTADTKAHNAALVGFFFSIPGLLTGSLWAKYTWGDWWTSDPKLNGVAISVLIYLAYFILRSSMEDEQKRARIGAVYNIFAFVMMNTFIMIIPRVYDSLHPGNGGNPAFGQYDLDNNMRMVFYPAVVGWILFGYWLLEIRNRISFLKQKLDDQ